MSVLTLYNVLDNECHVSWFSFDHSYWFFLSYLSYLFSLVYRVTFWFTLWILLEMSLPRNQKKYLLKNFRFVLFFICLFVPWQNQIFVNSDHGKAYSPLVLLVLSLFIYMAVSAWHCFAEYCSCFRSKPWRINLLRGKYYLGLVRLCDVIVIFVYIYVQQERSSLLKKLATLKDLDSAYPADKLAAADVDQSMQLSITGLETFCLSNKVLVLVCFKTFLVVFVLW